ncbi:MAG: YjjG family noncanonical pyrimidine nucleotidase [Lachnospiraceae bacterium]|nr:YjjG family noncanonical pyrimidine nucleotidase [Lachnospiraceae bacterium]MBQ7360843.1 YjjG family noncanonical pyrimidine nucleotidase [Lachnospiraceae bacterium]
MSKYKYILWDVDGTLLDFSYSQKISLFKCLEKIGVTGTDELNAIYTEINERWWKNLELGLVTKKELLSGRFVDFFEACNIACSDVDAFRESYQYELGVNFVPMEGAIEVCDKLKNLGFHQYVVTNGVTSTQKTKLSLSGFDKLMDEIFISEQIGVPKPHIDFFDTCFSKIKEQDTEFDLTKVLIVGDSLSSDMQGGINAGIDTCFYAPTLVEREKTVTYQIQSLYEVLSILGVK